HLRQGAALAPVARDLLPGRGGIVREPGAVAFAQGQRDHPALAVDEGPVPQPVLLAGDPGHRSSGALDAIARWQVAGLDRGAGRRRGQEQPGQGEQDQAGEVGAHADSFPVAPRLAAGGGRGVTAAQAGGGPSLSDRSIARTCLVRAPMEMKSTPSSAIARRPSRPTLPETSSGMRPANGAERAMRTASRRVAASKSSTRMRSQPASSASRSSSRVSTSTISGRSGRAARAAWIAAVTEPATRTWFSLSITASYRPMRWLAPPPARIAYFCAWRRPGRVLRVSRMVAPVPRTAST